ncbi:MAG: hypothetical protein LBE49_07335, partial [Deltaproteobacteria bacterium]|nr:hypothetical protein [Deltaproteobacteria bacterium]
MTPSQDKPTRPKTGEKDQAGPIWDRLKPAEIESAEKLASEYMAFLSEAKTERALGKILLEKARKAGFSDLAKGGKIARGGWLQHHGKLLGLFVPGRLSPEEGFNLVVAHGDAPRLDLKPKCLYEDGGLALIKSNLYGGLKKFQWLARPLALWGFCALKDGRQVEVRLGEDIGDPVLTITDILPHLDRKVQRDKRLVDAFPAERLNVLAGSIPLAGDKAKGKPGEKGDESKASKAKGRVKANFLKLLE